MPTFFCYLYIFPIKNEAIKESYLYPVFNFLFIFMRKTFLKGYKNIPNLMIQNQRCYTCLDLYDAVFFMEIVLQIKFPFSMWS